jgi:hypothetical protein
VTCLALDVLRVFLRSVDVSVAHRLLRGVAIHAVQFVLTFSKLANRLIVLDQAASFCRHLHGERTRDGYCWRILCRVAAALGMAT